ncbi:ATP-dependent DNA helicase [Luedemannella helvata]|uniref:DNA 3'-5' helicase n=1 Tax=Luedemannella helvata TaxID=349315 RepID=A0ABN2L3Z2_9ACTN
MTAMTGPRFTPEELGRRLGLRYRTSPQQQRIIAAPPDEPLLVVAGAGSGKTELMALRVMWLIANQHVRPDQVLGLTFTRKAAGELAHRIRLYLGRAVRLLGRDAQLAGEPTVSTYHAFAARVVREHGLRGGYEPSTRLLSEAACWQLADAVVRQYEGDMGDFMLGHPSATAAVLALAGELAEHLCEPADVARFTGRLRAEFDQRGSDRVFADTQKVLDRQRARLALLPLVRRYAERKAAVEAMDFGDQLRRAAEVARDHPEVGEVERDRFRVVLLDEYQDTSHAQVVLLKSLFHGGHPVTAVGDPCQSIYGWRGAGAGTLDRFPTDFPTASGAPAEHASLSVSWRNAPEILAVANEVSEPLRAVGLRVRELTAAPGRAAAEDDYPRVRAALLDSYLDEAEWLADRIDDAWQQWRGAPPAPTTAVLVRARKQIPVIEAALRARGLPTEVVGLGGLLDTPEVRDIVSTLRILADPTAGAALLRLLTGARWRLGPRDVVALYRRARQLAAARRGPTDDAPVSDRLDDATLAEALDDLGSAEGYSSAGYARLQRVRDELRALRRRLGQALPDLVADVAHTIGLDVEVAVRARATNGRATSSAGLARAHLDAFGDVAARFAEESEGATLSAFLAYLDAAEDEERGLPPGEVEVVDGAVQILTAHAAKGLEWDVVAVAGMCAGAFPGPATNADAWLRGIGVLPFPLRGDRSGLPELSLAGASDGAGVKAAITRFDEDWEAHHEREERRLAYVAVTRPRHLLLCSGYWWGENVKKPRGASRFLIEVAHACREGAGLVGPWAPAPPDGEPNPTMAIKAQATWPVDPLGDRRPALAEAAELVRAAGPLDGIELSADERAEADRWALETQLLLAERERERSRSVIEVALPAHLSVSQLVALRRDPQRLARRLRRPLPEAPDVYARRGTAFHLWLEQRFGAAPLLDLDELPGYGDVDPAPDEHLLALQEAFLASGWADRVPVRVEVPFATVVAGVVVRGRMDAVFAEPDGGFTVVDWKTGREPTGAAADAAAVQLAAYRLAWAELAGVPLAQVGAAFHYVASGVTVRPVDLLDEAGLTGLITAVPQAAS